MRIIFRDGLNPSRRVMQSSKQVDVVVFKLHHLVAVRADEMIVVGVIEEIGIVVLVVLSQIDLMQQAAFHE